MDEARVLAAYAAARLGRPRGFAAVDVMVLSAAVCLGAVVVAAMLDHAHRDDAIRADLAACRGAEELACACWEPEGVRR